MTEAEVYNNFYEGMTPECKDLVNSSSGGDFSRKRVSEAREILGRLIDAKKAYDHPRTTILRRGSVNVAIEQGEEKVEARIDKLEKALLSAIEKSNRSTTPEKVKAPGPEVMYPCYGPPAEADYQAQVNAVGSWNQGGGWNQNGHWIPGKQRDAPWRDHPNFRWTDGNQHPPPQPQNTSYPNPPENQPNWSSRNQEGQNNWGNRNQGNQSNWANRNQSNPTSSYVPPHQRSCPSSSSNPQPNHQGNQGPSNQYNTNHGPSGNFHPNQGHGPSNQQGSHSSQQNPRQSRNIDELVGDLISSQQHLQNNMQTNNDMVHKLQDAQQEQKAAMDMLTK